MKGRGIEEGVKGWVEVCMIWWGRGRAEGMRRGWGD